jgi:hypothetical protein
MKYVLKITILSIALWSIVCIKGLPQNTDCNVNIHFTTVTTGLGYFPNNVLAVWVETSDNQFVRTLKVMASHNKILLYTWNDESGGNTVDAITGATKTEHSPEMIVWDGKDTNQVVVPDGDYKIIVEFTEEHDQGPLLIVPFSKNTTDSDSTFNNETNFVSISINYDANLSNSVHELLAKANDFAIYPNPISNESKIKIQFEKNTIARLGIYSLNGQCIQDIGMVKLTGGNNYFELNNQQSGKNLSNGTYLLRLEYNNEIKVVKFIKQ